MKNNVIDFQKRKEERENSVAPQLNKKNIKSPHLERGKKFVAVTLSGLTIAGIIAAATSNPKEKDVILPLSVQDFYNNPNENDYTPDTQTLENFSLFEQALADYNKFSEKATLSVVEEKALQKAIQTLSENYSSFEKIHMFQTKTKIAQALGLSKDNVNNIILHRLSNYSNYSIGYPGGSLSNNNIPKELKKAIDDVIFLQITQDSPLKFDSVNKVYNNMLKFLIVDFEKNEDGAIVKSDEKYQPSSESILAHYTPIYENLIAKKNSQDGKLKKSQEEKLREVTHEMYGPLLDHLQKKLLMLASVSPEDFKKYNQIIGEICGQHADKKISFETIFPIVFNMSKDIDEILQGDIQLSDSNVQGIEQESDYYEK